MAENESKQATIAPGCREGRELSLDLTDPQDVGLVRQAIKRGWIKSLVRMDRIIEEAEAAAEEVDDVELYARLKDSHARTAATIAAVYTKNVHGEDAKTGTINNTQVNIYGAAAIPKALESEHGRDAIANLEDAIAESDIGTNSQPAPVGKA